MLEGLRHQLRPGEVVVVELHFAHAGDFAVSAVVSA
jgi:copper(I)-binding protein